MISGHYFFGKFPAANSVRDKWEHMACEIHAREKIDNLLTQAGWLVQDMKDTNIVSEVDRLLSIARETEAQVVANLKRVKNYVRPF
ncbi:MAG: hypothetical protein HY885_14790 [Deltaproteobacteria bacterium]|nr:hypothetical protein [Deltaproteobacteria bacterium]